MVLFPKSSGAFILKGEIKITERRKFFWVEGYHVTDLLIGSVSDLLQLSDEAVHHQRRLHLPPVTDQVSVKLTPPGREHR